MSTENVKKKQTVSSENMMAKIANALDAKDGQIDRKISKKEYNIFAEYAGLKPTDKESVDISYAIDELNKLVDQNPAKIVNYARDYLGIKTKLHREEEPLPQAAPNEKPSLSDTLWDNFVDTTLGTVNPALGIASKMRRLTKPIINHAVGKYMDSHSIPEIQEAIRTCADTCSSALPLASKLLHISVTASETTVGNHGEYRVHSPQQSRTRLSQLGMHENDTNAYGDTIDHFTSDKMSLKTVEFSKTSQASKVISNSELVKLAVEAWEQDGCPQKKYYSGCMNNKTDELLGINSCCITVTNKKDNGSSITYTGYVEDVYDYAEDYSNKKVYSSDTVDMLNSAAYKAQQKGAIKPYRVLIPFTTTVDKK